MKPENIDWSWWCFSFKKKLLFSFFNWFTKVSINSL